MGWIFKPVSSGAPSPTYPIRCEYSLVLLLLDFCSCNWRTTSADLKIQRLSGWALYKERTFCGWRKKKSDLKHHNDWVGRGWLNGRERQAEAESNPRGGQWSKSACNLFELEVGIFPDFRSQPCPANTLIVVYNTLRGEPKQACPDIYLHKTTRLGNAPCPEPVNFW